MNVPAPRVLHKSFFPSAFLLDSARVGRDDLQLDMGIDFSLDRWNQLTETVRLWWAGELDRPILGAVLSGRDPGRPEPDIPSHHFTAFYDMSVSAEAIVDRWDYDLSCNTYLGDAAPMVLPNFGAGVVAALLGAQLKPDGRTCWFFPTEQMEIADIHFEYDPGNVWLNRIEDICRAAVQRWGGLVQVAMTDLGGNLDILSSFRPSEMLPLDLYDHPDEVKRLLWEAHELWHRYYAEISEVLQPANPGYSAWANIFSPEPYYMLQCDFSYMISPEMFDEFVRPEIAATCKRLANTFYHQDGIGQLGHTDSLLSIADLDGIQWVPGDGKPQGAPWIEHYRKIVEAGRKVQLGDTDTVDLLAQQTGCPEKIYCRWGGKPDDKPKALETLRKYGVI